MEQLRQIRGTLLHKSSDVNLDDDDYDDAVVEWQDVSHACSAWLLLAGASVALHSNNSKFPSSEKKARRTAILSQLQKNPKACKGLLRMDPAAFNALCNKLRSTKEIRPNSYEAISEQLTTFIFIIGQKFTNRAVAFFVRRSGQTISKFFHNVLQAVISLEGELLQQPNGNTVAEKIAGSRRFFPYFKENPSAAALRGKTVNNWDKLEALFSKNIATGSCSFSGRDMHERLNRRLDLESESTEWDFLYDNNHSSAQNFGDASASPSLANASDDPTSATASGNHSFSALRKSKRKMEDVEKSELAKASEKLLIGIEKISTAMFASAREISKNGDIERNRKVFDELKSLDLRKPYMIRCFKYLAENPIAANTFLSVPVDFRADMLVKMVGCDHDSP